MNVSYRNSHLNDKNIFLCTAQCDVLLKVISTNSFNIYLHWWKEHLISFILFLYRIFWCGNINFDIIFIMRKLCNMNSKKQRKIKDINFFLFYYYSGNFLKAITNVLHINVTSLLVMLLKVNQDISSYSFRSSCKVRLVLRFNKLLVLNFVQIISPFNI